MTEEQQQLMAALDKFGGDRELAAAVLGKSVKAVEGIIYHCQELKEKHAKGPGGSAAPTQAETMHRPKANGNGETVQLDTHDRDLVISMCKEDKLLAEGLERLGLTPQEVKRSIALRDFSKNQFVESVQIVGASMTSICVQLGTQVTKSIERLEEVRTKLKDTNPIYRANLVDEEKYLSESLIAMSEQVRRMSDTAHRGCLLQAMIRYKLSTGRGRGDPVRPTKPGFSPGLPIDIPTIVERPTPD